MSRINTRTTEWENPHRLRIEAAARHLLHQSHYVAIRRVSCDFDGKVLTLRGRVPSYYEKQIAQSLVLQRLQCFLVLKNQLEVAPGTDTGSSTTRTNNITHVVRRRSPRLLDM